MFLRIVFALAIFFCGSIGSVEAKHKYKLSICAPFQNEADYLKEWIEYHRMLGVEHFYLYNNESTDHYLDVLGPYMEKGIVELTDWPSLPNFPWLNRQRQAYNHCLKLVQKTTKWLAIIDVDEFIVPMEHTSIPKFLKRYEKYGGVLIDWQNYGTSFLPTLPKDKLMIESLVRRYPQECREWYWYKTIFQPKHVCDCDIHWMYYKKGHYAVHPDKSTTDDNLPQLDKIRINHYWTRAEDFLFQVKIPRLEGYRQKTYTDEMIDEILLNSNRVEDKIIFMFVDPLRKRMGYK